MHRNLIDLSMEDRNISHKELLGETVVKNKIWQKK